MSQTIRVLIVDDHTIVRKGIRALLTEIAGIEVVGEAADGQEAVAQANSLRPDVILMDLAMPKMDGIELTARLWQRALARPCPDCYPRDRQRRPRNHATLPRRRHVRCVG